jgi:hypothetical protein
MGLIDYSDLVATTKLSDEAQTTDKPEGGETVIIGLIMGVVSFPIIVLMGLFVWHLIGLIIPIAVIGLGFWACGHYGTNDSLTARFRYRTTKRSRAIIERRLSDAQGISENKRLSGLTRRISAPKISVNENKLFSD